MHLWFVVQVSHVFLHGERLDFLYDVLLVLINIGLSSGIFLSSCRGRLVFGQLLLDILKDDLVDFFSFEEDLPKQIAGKRVHIEVNFEDVLKLEHKSDQVICLSHI